MECLDKKWCNLSLREKQSVENDKHLGLPTLLEHNNAANIQLLKLACQPDTCWKSYIITFPDRGNLTSSTTFCLLPNTPEEEIKIILLGAKRFLFDCSVNQRKMTKSHCGSESFESSDTPCHIHALQQATIHK